MGENQSLDTILEQAGILAWEEKTEEYEALRAERLALADGFLNARLFCDVAKLSCLRPITDEAMQDQVLELARRAVTLGEEGRYPDDYLTWFKMCVGMAEYRSGHFSEAEGTLEALEAKDPNLRQTAALYRVMSMACQGKTAEARELFLRTEEKMKEIPSETPRKHHDRLVTITAYREAGTMLGLPLQRMPD